MSKTFTGTIYIINNYNISLLSPERRKKSHVTP